MNYDVKENHELLLEMRSLLNKAMDKGKKFYILTFIDGNEIIPIDMADIGIRKFEEEDQKI